MSVKNCIFHENWGFDVRWVRFLMQNFHVRSDIQEHLAKAVLKAELLILRQRRQVRLLRKTLALFSIL